MAEKKAEANVQEETKPARQKVYISADRNGVQQIFVGVNGKGYTIPTNQDVFVDAAVYEVLRRSRIAMKERDEYINRCAGVKNMAGGEA